MAACGVGQLHLHDVGAEGAQVLGGLLHLGLDLGREALGLHERGHDADAHALDPVGEVRREVGAHGLARAVERVAAGDGVQGVAPRPPPSARTGPPGRASCRTPPRRSATTTP